jgi:homoserine dehydrogenase
VSASVQPVRLAIADPLAQVSETSSALTIETDTLNRITLIEDGADPSTTAYGMLVDMINIARGRFRGLPDPSREGG